MFMAEDLQPFQQHPLWNSAYSDNATAFLQPGPSAFGHLGLKTCQLDGVRGPLQQLPPHLESLAPTAAPYWKELDRAFPYGHGVQAYHVSSSAQKRFLFFDQSGDQIRLFSSSFHFPSQNHGLVANMPVTPQSLEKGKLEAGQAFLMKPVPQSKLDENYASSEGSDIREDSEEINALLYSNSFSEDDDDVNDADDELTSTGHSPFATLGGCKDHENIWELTEEVASSDGSTKRQKLLDGGYKKSSLVDSPNSSKFDRSGNYEDDVESSCALGRDLDKDMDSISGTRQKQAQIRSTFRILKSILPGMKSKDPVLIIDEAINYLDSLRQKAKVLGVSHPEGQSPH